MLTGTIVLAGYAWNDSFHNITQTTSAVNYNQCIYHKKSSSHSHAVETDFILLDLNKASNTMRLK